jgi:hypothetical protein
MAIAGFLKTVKEIKQKEVAAHQRHISLASLRRAGGTGTA